MVHGLATLRRLNEDAVRRFQQAVGQIRHLVAIINLTIGEVREGGPFSDEVIPLDGSPISSWGEGGTFDRGGLVVLKYQMLMRDGYGPDDRSEVESKLGDAFESCPDLAIWAEQVIFDSRKRLPDVEPQVAVTLGLGIKVSMNPYTKTWDTDVWVVGRVNWITGKLEEGI